MKIKNLFYLLAGMLIVSSCNDSAVRITSNFNQNWKFLSNDDSLASALLYDDSAWESVTLPHDWSILGEFSETHPATAGGGALPGGTGWYRKSFVLDPLDADKMIYIDFDGVYMNSKVWVNGHLVGERPNGYISFRYDISPYVKFNNERNIIAVRVDNSQQPNSRWYSGSGIYRNVWLVKTHKVHVDHWGTFITTPLVNEEEAIVDLKVRVTNSSEQEESVTLITYLINKDGEKVGSDIQETHMGAGKTIELSKQIMINQPELWSVDNPTLYSARTELRIGSELIDEYNTSFGIRYFSFDAEDGFSLNGIPMKINGVCNHHDLGCLGSAVNTRAIERQLEILKDMGCNAIRTAHNPPAPELLDLCDRKGFIVMDEAFDMWKKSKTPYDYSLYWDDWHRKDLRDLMFRDRNHPSIMMWSIGNEILEQWDSSGVRMVQDLYDLARSIDSTRPVTTANNPPSPDNNLNKPMVLDLIGYNYAHTEYEKFPQVFPGQKFIATETISGLATRGHYDMPSDSVRRWPYRWDLPFDEGNADNTVSAYDNVSAPWGSTHEETWKIIKKHNYLAGQFIWTGFDYLGEPTPYAWPSRSSYFGIIDLAGFPKDVYYMYQSEWTDEPVLHLFPHWNWEIGDIVDVKAYFNCDEVELFLNGESQGVKQKQGDDLHVKWQLSYTPGTIKAIGRTSGKEVLTKTINTAGEPAQIKLTADRGIISADGTDLSFVTVEILDAEGNLVPNAGNKVEFNLEGEISIAGVDNGLQTSHEPFKAEYRNAFNGKCLAVLRAGVKAGKAKLIATSEGLQSSELNITLE